MSLELEARTASFQRDNAAGNTAAEAELRWYSEEPKILPSSARAEAVVMVTNGDVETAAQNPATTTTTTTTTFTKDPAKTLVDDDPDPASTVTASLCFLQRLPFLFRRCLARSWSKVRAVMLTTMVLTYLAFVCYCMYYEFGSEPSIRLLVGSVIGLVVVVSKVAGRWGRGPCCSAVGSSSIISSCCSSLLNRDLGRGVLLRTAVRWCLYLLSMGGAMAVLVVDVMAKRPENLVCVGGLAVLILFCFFISRQPDKINWHAVFWGMGLQFWFAALIKKTTFGEYAFHWLADRFVELLRYTDKGSETVFGKTFRDHNFIFQIMPTLIFFNALISMFYYLGVVQIFIAKFGKFLSFCLGTSPIECVNAAANLILTLTEAPILIKPFMADMTQSELFAVMTGGFASIAGFLLYAFASFGAPVNHILTASVMSAPAALAFAKLIYPDERKPTIKAEDAYNVDIKHYGSMLGSLSKGAKDGLTMAGYVVVNMLVFVALLEFLDLTVLWFAERAGVYNLTFSVTYYELGKIITNGKVLQEYIDVYNGTWTSVGDDIFLEATNTTLVGGVISERSGILATYMVCGLSSMGSMGTAIGVYTSLAPSRCAEVYSMVPLALLAGNIASFSTACVAGLLYTD
ncbi:putative transporter HI_0519 isoform X2 [Babylonia areolata]|uniref:putative transporter HI_0519 isoform X2 n=1 Tax=Babylonia areolata TaxID=304850 RepID=UPI003FCF818C